jgi:hypothetical protein
MPTLTNICQIKIKVISFRMEEPPTRMRAYVQQGRQDAASGRRRDLGVVHGRDDAGEPDANAGDEARGHERGVAAAGGNGERAGHEEGVGEHERAPAAQEVGRPPGAENRHEHEQVHGPREHLDLHAGEAQVLPDEQLRAAHQRESCREIKVNVEEAWTMNNR